jgi:hypothetical protein
MSAASDYLSQQMTLAAGKAPIVTFASCQRSLAPSAQPHEVGIGLATFGWGINGRVHKDAAGKPDGLHFSEVYHWFSDRFTPSSSLHPPDLQYFRGGPGSPPHNNRDSLILTFTLDKMSRLATSSTSGVSRRAGGHVWDRVWDWVTGPTVVALKVVLWSWRTDTSVANAPTWTVSTSVVDGPSQQLVFNIPGSFQIPGAASAPRGAAPAVMLVSFNPQGEYGWL